MSLCLYLQPAIRLNYAKRMFSQRIGHLEGIESPISNAGGVVSTMQDVENMAKTAVGYIEDGSHTLEDRYFNYGKDFHYDPATGLMYNSRSMPGDGMDKEEKVIPEKARIAHAYGKKLVYNVAPVSENPEDETVELVRRAYAAKADAVIVNLGCKNVRDEKGNLQDALSGDWQRFYKLMKHLSEAMLPKPIWIRISPQENYGSMHVMGKFVKKLGIVSAVLAPNSWRVPMPRDSNGKPMLDVDAEYVSQSGPSTSEEAFHQANWAQMAFGDSAISVVQSGGIMYPEKLKRCLDAGLAGGAATTLFYSSEISWADSVNQLLEDFADI